MLNPCFLVAFLHLSATNLARYHLASYLCCSYVVLLAAFSLDTEQPDYDLDSDDDAFVNKLKKKMEISLFQFEEMIDRLEKGSGQQVGDTSSPPPK